VVTTWSRLTNISNVNSLATDGKNLFAATSKGVSVSTDTGATWTLHNERHRVWRHGKYHCGLRYHCLHAGFINGQCHVCPSNPGDDWIPSAVAAISAVHDTLLIYPNPLTGLVTIRGSYAIRSVSVMNVLGVRELVMPFRDEEEVTLNLSALRRVRIFSRSRQRRGVSCGRW